MSQESPRPEQPTEPQDNENMPKAPADGAGTQRPVPKDPLPEISYCIPRPPERLLEHPADPAHPPEIPTQKHCCVQVCCGPNTGGTGTPVPVPVEQCSFDIYLSRVRVNITGADDWLFGSNEYTIIGEADGATLVHPSPTTWITIFKAQNWRSINRFIKRITFNKGDVRYVALKAGIIEWDMIANSSEVGESQLQYMQLYCNSFIPPVQMLVDLQGLTILPTTGSAWVEFVAYQV